MSSDRAVRVASLLTLEGACQTVERVVLRLASVLTQRQAEQAFDEVVGSILVVVTELSKIDNKIKGLSSTKERQEYREDLVKRLAQFLKNIRNLFENFIKYRVGNKLLCVYQNEDLRKKVQDILDLLRNNWETLTSGLEQKGDLALLVSLRREVERQLSTTAKHERDRGNSVHNIDLDDAITPRQWAGR